MNDKNSKNDILLELNGDEGRQSLMISRKQSTTIRRFAYGSRTTKSQYKYCYGEQWEEKKKGKRISLCCWQKRSTYQKI